MRTIGILSVLFAVALFAGCGKDDKKKGGDKADKGKADKGTADKADKGTADKADKGTADKADKGTKAGDGADMPGMANKMMYCPSAVPGAKTEIAEADGALVVTVTAEGDAIADVRRRAAHLESVYKAESATTDHSGEGTGGGGTGQCPVVMDDTTLAVESVDGGVKITIKPADAAKLADLKKTAETRLENLPGGGGKGGHRSGSGGKDGDGEGKGEGKNAGKGGK